MFGLAEFIAERKRREILISDRQELADRSAWRPNPSGTGFYFVSPNSRVLAKVSVRDGGYLVADKLFLEIGEAKKASVRLYIENGPCKF